MIRINGCQYLAVNGTTISTSPQGSENTVEESPEKNSVRALRYAEMLKNTFSLDMLWLLQIKTHGNCSCLQLIILVWRQEACGGLKENGAQREWHY